MDGGVCVCVCVDTGSRWTHTALKRLTNRNERVKFLTNPQKAQEKKKNMPCVFSRSRVNSCDTYVVACVCDSRSAWNQQICIFKSTFRWRICFLINKWSTSPFFNVRNKRRRGISRGFALRLTPRWRDTNAGCHHRRRPILIGTDGFDARTWDFSSLQRRFHILSFALCFFF